MRHPETVWELQVAALLLYLVAVAAAVALGYGPTIAIIVGLALAATYVGVMGSIIAGNDRLEEL